MQPRPQKAKASLQARSSFSTSRKAGDCPPPTIRISANGPKNSFAAAIAQVSIAQESPSKKALASPSPLPMTFAPTPHHLSSPSGRTTTLARPRQDVSSRKFPRPRQPAAPLMLPSGNSRNPRVAKNSHLDAPRLITAMEIVTPPATLLMHGFST